MSFTQKTDKRILKVAFYSLDSKHACPMLRLVSPLSELARKGLIISKQGIVKKDNSPRLFCDSATADSSEILIFQRAFTCDFVKTLIRDNRQNKVIIYEMDDDLLNIPKSNPVFEKYRSIKSKIIEMIRFADGVTVTTEYLKRKLLEYNKNVYVLPNLIDLKVWFPGRRQSKRKNSQLTIGYSGTITHEKDLEIVIPLVKKIKDKYKDKVVFKFIGCIPSEFIGIEGIEYDRGGYEYKEYAQKLMNSGIDIALAPLEDNEFNRAKSNIKYLEYSISRIPGVYSDITPYSSSINSGVNGFLAKDDPTDWYKKTILLIENDKLRNDMVNNAFNDVVFDYALQKKYYLWYDLYCSLLEAKIR